MGPDQLPILPSSDFDRTLEYYGLLGFTLDSRYGDHYLTTSHPWGIELHFYGAGRVKTTKNDHAVYVRFDSSATTDALHEMWAAAAESAAFAAVAGKAGRITTPSDTDYGLREFALLDFDGNLLRVGGMLPVPDPGPVLVLIDVQVGLDAPEYGERNNPDAEAHMAELLATWRERQLPVIHVVHDSLEDASPLKLDQPGGAIKPEATPVAGEPVIPKHANSCFIGTPVQSMLVEMGATEVVMAGLTTNHCVSTSVRMAANLGFDVTLVSDATAAHPAPGSDGFEILAAQIHEIALASLRGEFADVRDTAEVIAALA
ncbi:MAG: isochorismatase family protein [Acidimicrobiales bacterium]